MVGLGNPGLVVGLGNPGREYEENRHNVGFRVVEKVRRDAGLGSFDKKFSGEVAKGRVGDADVVLLRPLTYMNLSGRSVQRTAAFFQIPPEHIVVVHDDLDLPFGTVRVKENGGTSGHNGLRSIHAELGTDAYLRVRIGIGRPTRGSGEDYVLSDFSKDESIDLDAIVARAADAVTRIVTKGPAVAMNEFNQRDPKTPK